MWLNLNALMRVWQVAAAAILVSTSGVGAQITVPSLPTVRVAGDTLWILVAGQRFPASLQPLHSPDTTGFGTTEAITVIGTNDTLIVRLGTEPFEFLILWKGDTIREVFVPRRSDDEVAYPARVELLKKYRGFGSTIPPGLRPFTYQDASDSTLTRIREDFRLDSVAGAGDDVTRALRLMRWLHQSASWDGNKENPQVRSAHELLVACTKEGRTANCGGLASMLNTILLAEGLKSRQLVCRPYDTADQECHSVNIVFASHQKKWILIDPTHDAHFQNRAGMYLSPLELRQAMANGDSIVVPADINVNGVSESRNSYLGYLSKNLFRFSSWQKLSSADKTGSVKQIQVFLSPSGYMPGLVGKVDSSEAWYTGMYTDDSSVFWAAPQ